MLEFVFAVLSLAVFVSGRTVQLNVGCSGDQCGNGMCRNSEGFHFLLSEVGDAEAAYSF